MAMNKTEKAAFEALKVEAALRWPTEAEPKPLSVEEIKAEMVDLDNGEPSPLNTRKGFKGWCHNSYNGTVEPAWSNGHTHGRGSWSGRHGSQGGGRIYRTRREAALACRWEMCREMARRLRFVDKLFEEE